MDQEHRVCELLLFFSLALIHSWKQAEEDTQHKSRCAQTEHLSQVCITCMPLFKGSWPLKVSVYDLCFISSPSIYFAGSKPLQRKEFLYRGESIHRKQNTWRNLCKWRRSFSSWTSKSQHDLELELLFKQSVSHAVSVVVCVALEPKDTFWKMSWNKREIVSVRSSTLLSL